MCRALSWVRGRIRQASGQPGPSTAWMRAPTITQGGLGGTYRCVGAQRGALVHAWAPRRLWKEVVPPLGPEDGEERAAEEQGKDVLGRGNSAGEARSAGEQGGSGGPRRWRGQSPAGRGGREIMQKPETMGGAGFSPHRQRITKSCVLLNPKSGHTPLLLRADSGPGPSPTASPATCQTLRAFPSLRQPHWPAFPARSCLGAFAPAVLLPTVVSSDSLVAAPSTSYESLLACHRLPRPPDT